MLTITPYPTHDTRHFIKQVFQRYFASHPVVKQHCIKPRQHCQTPVTTLYDRILNTPLAGLQDMFDILFWDIEDIMQEAVQCSRYVARRVFLYSTLAHNS